MAKHTNIEIISSLIVSENGIQYKLNNNIYGIKYANNNWQLNNDGTNYYTIITTDNLNDYVDLNDYYTKGEIDDQHITDLYEHTDDDNTVPTCKAVVDYVSNIDTQHIFLTDVLPPDIEGVPNSIYVAVVGDGLETYIYDHNKDLRLISKSPSYFYSRKEIDDKHYITSGVTELTNFYTKTEINEKVTSVFKFKGTCTWDELLEKENPITGDVWQITNADPSGNTNCEYAYNGSEWFNIGYNIDLSSYYTSTEIDQMHFITSSVTELANFYTKTEIEEKNYITSSVAELTNFYTKNDINQQISGKLEFNICQQIPEQLEEHKLYITPFGQIAALISGNPTNLSVEYVTDLLRHITDNNTVPTCKAVTDYMDQQISSKLEFDINQQIPEQLEENKLYVTPSGQVAALISGNITPLSMECITNLSQHETDNNTIPTCKSVVDYVSGVIENIDGAQHIFYVNALPEQNNRVENSIYVISGTNKSYIIDNNKQDYIISHEIVNNINASSTNDNVPGTKAVADYISGVFDSNPKQFITSSVTDLENFFNKNYITGNYYIKGDIDGFINDFITSSVTDLTNFYNKTEIDQKHFITSSVTELTNFYTKDDIEKKNYITSSVTDLKYFLNKTELEIDYYDKNQVTALINDKIASLFKFKGTCTWDELTHIENPITGDVWQITNEDPSGNTNCEYAYNGEYWVNIGYNINLSEYAKIDDIPTSLIQLTVRDYNDLNNKPVIPSATSQLENDSGYLTEHQSLSSYALISDIPTGLSQLENDQNYITNSVTELTNFYNKDYITGNYYIKGDVNSLINDFITSSVTELTNFYTKTEIEEKNYITSSVAELVNFYNKTEIEDKHYITSSVTELTNFYTKNDIDQQLSSKLEFSINDQIPGTLEEHKLYITPSGQIAALISGNPTNLSIDCITDLSLHTTDNSTIPTCKAVVDYIEDLSFITNATSGLTYYYNKDEIDQMLSGDGEQHIYYVEQLPQQLTNDSIYVLSSNQSIIVDQNGSQHNMGYPVINNINNNTNDNNNVPTCKAVTDYVSGTINNNSQSYMDIPFGINEEYCSWSGNNLIINTGLINTLVLVQIFITENNTYKHVDMPFVIDKSNYNVIIDCSNYVNQTISVKIIK